MSPPIATHCNLLNHTEDNVTLDSQNYWHGYGQPPAWLQSEEKGNFKHNADNAGSVGGIAYLLQDKIKWIIAWSNSEDEPNKVYTKIIKYNEAINWDDIKANLRKSSSQNTAKSPEGYTSELVIDATSPTPKMTAILRPVQ